MSIPANNLILSLWIPLFNFLYPVIKYVCVCVCVCVWGGGGGGGGVHSS